MPARKDRGAVRPVLYGLMAEFTGPEELLDATRRTASAGYKKIDTYSPMPIEGLAEAVGFHTRLPLIVLIGGIVGGLGGYFMQYWIAAIDYPLNIGGRPLNSWPAFIPVTFEMTILFAGLTAVIAMLALNHLPEPYHPVFNVERFELATDNRFFLVVEAADPKFDEIQTKRFLEELHPKGVYLVDA